MGSFDRVDLVVRFRFTYIDGLEEPGHILSPWALDLFPNNFARLHEKMTKKRARLACPVETIERIKF
jgi:hypothetical protein